MRFKLAALAVISFWPLAASAYIDPGTGSMLIQGLIAAIAAIGVTLKLYWHKLVALFRRKPSESTQPVRNGSKAEEQSRS